MKVVFFFFYENIQGCCTQVCYIGKILYAICWKTIKQRKWKNLRILLWFSLRNWVFLFFYYFPFLFYIFEIIVTKQSCGIDNDIYWWKGLIDRIIARFFYLNDKKEKPNRNRLLKEVLMGKKGFLKIKDKQIFFILLWFNLYSFILHPLEWNWINCPPKLYWK